MLFALGIFAVVVIGPRLFGGDDPRDMTLPSHLAGTWESQDDRFAGRALELSATTLRFVDGGEGAPTLRIESVGSDVDPTHGMERYDVSYLVPGEEREPLRVALTLDRRSQTLIVGARTSVEWKRVSP